MNAALEITSPELAERMQRSKAWRRCLVAASNGRCHYCNRPGVSEDIGPDDRVWHVDHKTPVARGGSDDDENLVLACARCNLTTSIQPYEQFREFARSAYWVPDDWRVAEFELDLLMGQYTDALQGWRMQCAEDPTWRVDREKYAIDFVTADGYREVLFNWDTAGHPEYLSTLDTVRNDALNHLEVLARMHRMIPALVAEIRILRADRAAQDRPMGVHGAGAVNFEACWTAPSIDG